MTTNAGQRYDQEVVDLLKALGRAYLENGENQRAADKFRQLVNNGIEDSEILTNFALVLARSELITEEALSIYKKSVAANETDEGLYLTLATLFLKKEVVEDPALKVYRRSLKFSPPFEEEIRTALERVFRQSTKSIDIAELRQTLLDCGENPELLSVYLTTAWRESKFDDALTVLKDLYQHSHENPNYLKPICETLLEKKARSEENGLAFEITPIEVQLSLKFQNLDEPLRRIADLEIYLDLKNLFLNFKPNGRKKLGNDEYEFFILDKSLPKKGTNPEGQTVAVQVDPIFDFERDFIQKLEQNESTMPPESAAILNHCNTLGIFEIANFDANPDSSKLPFVTFLKSISAEMNRVDEVLVCPTGNGIITLNSDPDKLVRIAVVILQRLQRYNQVVDDSEKIKMRVTAHSSLVPFVNLEKASIKELRKAVKVHTLPMNSVDEGSARETLGLRLTESVASAVNGHRTQRLGEYRLRYFPHPQKIFTVITKENTAATDQVAVSTSKPQRFGKYHVVKPVRDIQLYSTFEGYDPQLERMVIIKAYRMHAFAGFKEIPLLRKQFFEEVRKLNRINHPNISVIYDAGEEGDILYLVREYIEGEILSYYLLKDGLPEINRTLDFYRQICKILAAHHEEQIWHKNLKPDNIFITSQREIKLADSGLLQVRHSEKVWNDDIDSQAYSAPEQIQGAMITQACDIFQLGVMLYESLTGVHPFRGKNAREVRVKILADEVVPPSQFRADIPKALEEILAKALAKAPNQRYSYIHEFSADIKKLIPSSAETTSKRVLEVSK